MKLIRLAIVVLLLSLSVSSAHAMDKSLAMKIGGHLYSNEFLDSIPGMSSGAFASPYPGMWCPPVEAEFIMGFDKWFSLGTVLGSYMGRSVKQGNEARTQTVYALVVPRLELNVLDSLMYFGLGIGCAWYNFSYRDQFDNPIQPWGVRDDFVFMIAPSNGTKWEINDDLDLSFEYRYIVGNDFADPKSFNVGGHLFLLGVIAKF